MSAPKAVSFPASSLRLSLIPTGDETEEPVNAAPVKSKEFFCPKCELAQSPSAECVGCGVIFAEYQAAASAVSDVDSSASVAEKQPVDGAAARTRPSVSRDDDHEGDREGVTAMAIGGAIGFAAAASGARGNVAAAACAVLVVMAIFGGKYMYMYMSSYQQDIANMLNDESSMEMQELMEMVIYEAEEFALIIQG